MKYYMIAGEPSGDLHGSNLIKELLKLDLHASIRCWGGDLMRDAGGTLVKHYMDLAFMGFVEVIKNLPAILQNLKFCKQDILTFNPDALILIDYPGFNLRIAKWGKQQGFKIIFYISPQVWAWKANRVKSIKAYVDKMLVILPFEKEYYRKWNYPVEYVGHPLVEVVQQYKSQIVSKPIAIKSSSLPIIALLPGSRKQEILKKLPIMLGVTSYFASYQFIVAEAPGMPKTFYEGILKDFPNVTSITNATYELLSKAKAACVTSGTATLETALFGVPEVVCYKGGAISFLIAKQLVKVKYISLVNLIMDKQIVQELIQDELTVNNLRKALSDLLENPERIKKLRQDYQNLTNILKQGGNASANAAASILLFLHT